jgi:hypothetical protein
MEGLLCVWLYVTSVNLVLQMLYYTSEIVDAPRCVGVDVPSENPSVNMTYYTRNMQMDATTLYVCIYVTSDFYM